MLRWLAVLLLLSGCSTGPDFTFGSSNTKLDDKVGETVILEMVRHCIRYGCGRDPTTKSRSTPPPRIYNRIIMPEQKTKQTNGLSK